MRSCTEIALGQFWKPSLLLGSSLQEWIKSRHPQKNKAPRLKGIVFVGNSEGKHNREMRNTVSGLEYSA